MTQPRGNDERTLNGPIDDPASWATNIGDADAVRELVRAAASALLTLEYGRRFVNPEEVGTHLDLAKIERELRAALARVGHRPRLRRPDRLRPARASRIPTTRAAAHDARRLSFAAPSPTGRTPGPFPGRRGDPE